MTDPSRPRAVQDLLFSFPLSEYEAALHEVSTLLKLNTRLVPRLLHHGDASADALPGIQDIEVQTRRR